MIETVPNMSAKSLLGKLLATEDITIEQQPVHTAMFDVESRTLTLPIWQDMSNTLTDMLIEHEVGHAIFSPNGAAQLEEALDAMDPSGRIPEQVRMDYLNVVEDARIERLMQEKFEGTRRDFKDGYADLVDRDFFDIEGRDIDEMQFIDRLNLHYKIGAMVEVAFSDDERAFIDAIDGADTFEDVVEIATDIMRYADAKKRAEQQSDMGMSVAMDADGDEQGMSDAQGGEGESEDSDDSGNGEGQSGEGEEEGNSTDGDGPTSGDSGDGSEDDGEGSSSASMQGSMSPEGLQRSHTVQAMQNNLAENTRGTDGESSIQWIDLPERMDLSEAIVPNDEILQKIRYAMGPHNRQHVIREFERFRKDSSKIVSNMVKRFEMKKAADEHQRTMQSGTGILDPLKMVNYRWEEDIFLKVNEVQEGKNHGLVLFVDWSGSMSENIVDTVKQMLVTVMFCQKVGIPYDVYAFTTAWGRRSSWDWDDKNTKPGTKVGELEMFRGTSFLNILTSSCKRADFTDLAAGILSVACNNSCNHRNVYDLDVAGMSLGGTPLDDQIIAARQILTDFKTKHGVQIVNAVFLTDGYSGSSCITSGRIWDGEKWDGAWQKRGLRASDGTLIPLHSWRNRDTETLLEWLTSETGIPTIGIFLNDARTDRKAESAVITAIGYDSWRDVNDIEVERLAKKYRREGALSFGRKNGYSEYIIMACEDKKPIKGLDDLNTGAKATVVANAMIREAKKRKAMTRIMDIFVDRIAMELS